MHTVLRATSVTLAGLLEDRFAADKELGPLFGGGAGALHVSLNTPREMQESSAQGVSVWLYRVVRDEQFVNAPPERVASDEIRDTPLPLRLYYLMTPVVTIGTTAPALSPAREQTLLGKVLQVFHEHPVVRGPDLRDQLQGTPTRLTVRLETLTLEEITRVWYALQRSYQLSVSYEVTVAFIRPALQPSGVTPVAVAEPDTAVIVEGPA
jgi:hypothetical protein